MILNIAIVIFVLGIAYWQGLQGFFSAFLHLILVIVAGTLAFAFWEPLSMGMLAGMMPRYAWSIGLVMPFVFILLILRFVMDKVVTANLDFSQLTNLIAGGICGAIAAVLTAGICIISINYLPGDADNFGYQPYTINPATGEVATTSGKGLWIGVDSITASVFSTLSNGSFAPANGKSLARQQPELVRRSFLMRLRGDGNSSTIATPGSVVVTAHYDHPTPLIGLPALLIDGLRKQDKLDLPTLIASEGRRLVAIETEWTNKDKNYDGDPRLRVFPNQVELVTFPKDNANGDPSIHLPIAFSHLKDPTTNNRQFTVVNNDAAVAMTESAAPARLTFLFLVPAAEVESYLMVRNLRLPLTETTKAMATPQATELLALLGEGAAVVTPVATTPGTTAGEKQGGRSGIKADDVQITQDLPAVTSKTLATDLEFTASNEVRRGESLIKPPTGPISNANRVDKVYVADGQAVVRIKMARDAAQSFYGQAVAAAGALHPMILRDNRGNDWQPTGYVLYQTGTRIMTVRYDPQKPIRAVSELPIRQMGETDELYVYFLVEKGVTLLSFQVGSVHSQDLPRIEVK